MRSCKHVLRRGAVVLAALASGCSASMSVPPDQPPARQAPGPAAQRLPQAPPTIGQSDPQRPVAGTTEAWGREESGVLPDPDAVLSDQGGPEAGPLRMAWIRVVGRGVDVMIHAPSDTERLLGAGEMATLSHGAGFQLEVRPGGADLQEALRLAELDSQRDLVAVVEQSPDTLVYSTRSPDDPQVGFHFVAQVSVDGRSYHCRNAAGYRHSLAEVRAMLGACRSMRASGEEIAEEPGRKTTR